MGTGSSSLDNLVGNFIPEAGLKSASISGARRPAPANFKCDQEKVRRMTGKVHFSPERNSVVILFSC